MKTRRLVTLDLSDIQWLKEHYPEGSLSSVLVLLLKKFRAVHEHTPSEYALIGAKALKDALEQE